MPFYNESRHTPKINPARRQPRRPDGTPDDNDRVEIGPPQQAFEEWAALGLTPPDLDELRAYRLGRVRQELRKHGYAGILLWDPINIRYATDSSNMQVFNSHIPSRACFIATEGPVVLFEYFGCEHLCKHLILIDEIRPTTTFYYWESGDRVHEFAARFAAEIAELVRAHGGGERRLAVDKIEIDGVHALEAQGIRMCNGQEVMEHARAIKDTNELRAVRCALATAEIAMDRMEKALRPGMTEIELWSILHAENISRGGEWIESRVLSSGPRTNPWFQECGPRVIQEGDLVAFDTDLIGPYGYCADISRTWVCGDVRPTNEQSDLYRIAEEQIAWNSEILKPGRSFREIAELGYKVPEKFFAQRYAGTHHGVGLCDEYPALYTPEDFDDYGYDGVLEPGMVICVESYIGEEGGKQGVKLEDQLLLTETGVENLTRYPLKL